MTFRFSCLDATMLSLPLMTKYVHKQMDDSLVPHCSVPVLHTSKACLLLLTAALHTEDSSEHRSQSSGSQQ